MSTTAPPEPEETLIFLKPETVMRGLIGEIISRFERKGLIVAGLKLIQLSEDQARSLYAVHLGKHFYDDLVDHVTSGPVLAAVLKGPRSIAVVRKMIGVTDPASAEPGSIRGDLALWTTCNAIHASDSPQNAKREIEIFFRRDEILNYEKPTEQQYFLK